RIEMLRLRVEFAGEIDNFFGREPVRAEGINLTRAKIPEIQLLLHLASGIEAKMHHVAILHDIVLAFEAKFAGFPGSRFAAESNIVVIGDHFGPDKSLLEIAVNDTRRLGRARSLRHGPG